MIEGRGATANLPTAVNYATAAIEDLGRWRRQFRDAASALAIQNLIDSLRRSEKFLLPDDASLLDVPAVHDHYIDLLRLPYPQVALEFKTTPARNGGSRKGLVLCLDGSVVAGLEADEKPDSMVVFTPLFWSETQRLWHPTGHTFFLNRDKVVLQDGKLVDGVYSLDFIPAMLDHLSDTQRQQEANFNLKFALDAIIEFCLTVNCANVGHYAIEPPAALNKKRAKNGKEPLYTYKILTIPGESRSDPDGSGDSSRSGPRLHLRRGHLRRLSTGKVIWIRHTMVGSLEGGVVEKDYRVKGPG